MIQHINNKYEKNDNYFDIIDSNEKAYFLGLMYSDGSVTDRSIVITLQERDGPILERFKKALAYTGPVRFGLRKKPNHQDSRILRIYSWGLVTGLSKHGCFRNKTYTLRYPVINSEYNSHFIRGVFDGDGCIVNNGGNGYYFSITGNTYFLEDINEILCREIGISQGTISRKNVNNYLFSAIQQSKRENLLKIRDYLYKDCEDLYIERKYNKFFEITPLIKNTSLCLFCEEKAYAKGYCKKHYHQIHLNHNGRREDFIVCKNIHSNEINRYKTIKEASTILNIVGATIYGAIHGKRICMHKYIFYYESEPWELKN